MSIVMLAKQMPTQFYDTRNVGVRWLNVLKKYEKLILADYQRTTDTWNHAVYFDSEIKFSGANPRLMVWTDDDIYEDVDSGTDIRYDVMTTDFVPKTITGILNSFPGEGGYAYSDYENPRPGIQARLFSFTITKKYENPIQNELLEATVKGLAARKRG